MSGMGKPGDEQTWVYDADTDRWYAGAASGGTGGSVSVLTGSGGRVNYHDTTYNPVGLWQLSGSLVDIGSKVTHLTIGAGTQRHANMGPGLRGFQFDGSTFLVNTASLPASMCLTGSATVEMLAIIEPGSTSQTLFLIAGLTGDSTGQENYLFQLTVGAAGELSYFAEQDVGTNISFATTGSCVPFNELCHIAMTRDGSNVVRFYVNGSLLEASTALAQANTGSSGPSTARVLIGTETAGSFSTIGTTPANKTSIASIKLVDRELNAAEIAAEYQRTIGGLYVQNAFVSQSIINNNYFLSGVVQSGFTNANYFFVTASNEWLVQGGSVFVGMPGMTGSITTNGGPVLISVNANYVAQSGSPTALFSLAKNGVNLGHPLWGMQAAGPKVNSYNENVSLWYMDFPPAGTHTYSFIGCNPTGSGYIGNYGVHPGAIMAFELPRTANVVTASSMLQHTVAGTDIVGLSASILPTRGPVLALCSLNYNNTSAGNWAWSNIHRDGTGLGSTFGIALSVGTNALQYQNMSEMVVDTGVSFNSSHTYTVRTTNGAGTGVTSRNNMFATLILIELSDVNWKYSTSATQTNLGASYTDFIGITPTPSLQTRGRPIMLLAAMQSNTTTTTGRAAFSFLRNGSSIITASKGMQLTDGENTSDWNRVPTMMWFDEQPAGFYTYQVAGYNVSGSNNMQQGPTLSTFLIYELDPIGGQVFGGWLDTGGKLSTTASISISDGTERLTDPSQKGQDVYFYVSGTYGLTGSVAKKAVFGGDVLVSGSISTALAPITAPLSSASWQVVNLGNATITDEQGTIFISKPSQAGPQVTALVRGVPATPWKATIALDFSPTFGGVAGLAGMYLRQSSDGKMIGQGFHWDSGGVWRWYLHKLNSATSANSDYLAQNYNMFAPRIWLQIEDNGTTRFHRISWDGKYFDTVFSVSRTDFMTADQVGFGVDTQGARAAVRLVSFRME